MTIRLRAHHLLCTLTFKGVGYNLALIADYTQIVQRLNAGEDVLIVSGPDDACSPLLTARSTHCVSPSVLARDIVAAHVLSIALGQSIAMGTTLRFSAENIAKSRQVFRTSAVRKTCQGCEWLALCTDIASHYYAQTLLRPARAHKKRTIQS